MYEFKASSMPECYIAGNPICVRRIHRSYHEEKFKISKTFSRSMAGSKWQ